MKCKLSSVRFTMLLDTIFDLVLSVFVAGVLHSVAYGGLYILLLR